MEIKENKDYKTDAWKEYYIDELQSWVTLLVKRATHRNNIEKAKKDLQDARNYLDMLESSLEEEFKLDV